MDGRRFFLFPSMFQAVFMDGRYDWDLWSEAAAALEGDGFTGDVVGVFACEEDSYATDVLFRVCKVAEGDALDGLVV